MRNIVLLGDVREQLKSIPDGSVQTCVTSPPYFGLRDYGHEGQIGLEPTPDAYVAEMVNVFREVRRVLRDDGTLWLNLGDSYSRAGGQANSQTINDHTDTHREAIQSSRGAYGLKPKDLIGIPWRVAFALQADGWYLRADIIWNKPRILPESVTDRVTRSHEYIFHLTKSERYYYDHEAIKEPCVSGPFDIRRMEEKLDRVGGRTFINHDIHDKARAETNIGKKQGVGDPSGRNKRSVWTIGPKSYNGAHFATFPEELPELCIRAGTSEKGACSTCGKAWERTEQDDWEQACGCEAASVVPCIVLDPFSGSGTTLAVAKMLRRDYLGVELNPEYHKLIDERLRPAIEMEIERQGFESADSLEQE